MDYRIFYEWDPECGLNLDEMYPLREEIESGFKNKIYGSSISKILVIIICRGRDFKQRKLFKRKINEFSYDIILDFFLIKNLEKEEKKKLIKYQVVEHSKLAFENYKFTEFDKTVFINDLKELVTNCNW